MTNGLLWLVIRKLVECVFVRIVFVSVEFDTIWLWLNSEEHTKWYVQVGDIISRKVHEVCHQDSAHRTMADDEDVILDPLNFTDHVPKSADDLQIAFSADTWIDVAELVGSSLRILLGEFLLDVFVSHALERTGIEFFEHLPVFDVVIVVILKALCSLYAAL